MVISGRKVKLFLFQWGKGILKNYFGPLGVIGTLASIASYLRVPADSIRAEVTGALILGLGVTIIWVSKPKGRLDISDIVSQRLTMRDLNEILLDIPRFGLVGAPLVGKSTLLNTLGNREQPSTQTEAPYVVIVPVPDTRPTAYVALVDTVGREHPNQADVIKDVDGLVVFLDHNESSSDGGLQKARLETHKHLLSSNILPSLKQASKVFDPILVIQNKSDLWAGNIHTERRMDRLGQLFRDEALKASSTSTVEIIPRYSNLKTDDIARIIKRLGSSNG